MVQCVHVDACKTMEAVNIRQTSVYGDWSDVMAFGFAQELDLELRVVAHLLLELRQTRSVFHELLQRRLAVFLPDLPVL